MSVKITISTTTSAELGEILKALYPVQIRRKYRLKKKPLSPDGKKYIAYLITDKRIVNNAKI